MAKTLNEKKANAEKLLNRLATKERLSDREVERQYKALHDLADVNTKTMTVQQAYKWAESVIKEEEDKAREAFKKLNLLIAADPVIGAYAEQVYVNNATDEIRAWAWRCVGAVEQVHRGKLPGPRPGSMDMDVPEGYDKIVLAARRKLKYEGFDLSTKELSTLLEWVNRLRGLMPPIAKTELRKVLRRLKKSKK